MNTPTATKVQVPRQAWKVAVLAGMASYLDAGAIGEYGREKRTFTADALMSERSDLPR